MAASRPNGRHLGTVGAGCFLIGRSDLYPTVDYTASEAVTRSDLWCPFDELCDLNNDWGMTSRGTPCPTSPTTHCHQADNYFSLVATTTPNLCALVS